ncbi:DUF3093 domain-containing protein [Microbacterium sp. NC79]|uniref:DUF3093 domain-containing protein n=1 Tax=Microbacterium sp. NC79 TaxID=2851009 RepID=UPI0020B8C6B4|nr:DUF3093 domain-containing protein [Microbacterium sp. NC79]
MSTSRTYRERLTPSLWLIVAAMIVAPMSALVFMRDNGSIALIAGGVVAIAVVALMLSTSKVVEVSGGELRIGKAHIPVEFLGEPVVTTGYEARLARGQNLKAHSFTTIRGGIDGIVTVAVVDPADSTPAWVVSSRTPDRLAAAIGVAQAMRTRGK